MGHDEIERALKDYEEHYGRPVPIKYDVLRFSDEHRRFDALLRRFWDDFHPLVRDIFTSFALEFKYIIEEMEKLEEEVDQFEEKREFLENEREGRLGELNDELDKLKSKFEEYKKDYEEKEQRIEELEEEIKEKDALIVTQRRQLDNYIESSIQFEQKQEDQEETITQSIESVTKFTDQLEFLETEMLKLEKENQELKSEKNTFKSQLKETEEQYIQEIEEVNNLYQKLRDEVTELQFKISTLHNEKSDLEDQLDDLKLQKQEYEKKYEDSRDNQIELENKIETIKKDKRDMEKRLDKVTSQNKKLKQMANELLEKQQDILQQKKISPETEEIAKQKMKKKVKTYNKITADEIEPYVYHAKKKTGLEEELEYEQEPIEEEIENEIDNTQQDLPSEKVESKYSKLNFTERDEKGIDAVRKIKSKIESTDESQENIIGTIKSTRPKETTLDKLLNSGKIQEKIETMDAQDEIPSNLRRMMENENSTAKEILDSINKTELEFLNRVMDDFPDVPEHVPKSSDRKDKESKKSIES